MPKRNIYITLMIAGGLILAGGLIWLIFFSSSQTNVSINNGGPEVNITGSAAANLKVLSGGPIVSAHKSGDAVFFYDLEGQLWQIKNGSDKAEKADQKLITNISEVIWSGNLKNIVRTGLEQGDSQYLFSDFTTKALGPIKSGIKSLAFSPDSKKIVYYVSSGSSNSLFTSDPDGKNQRTLVSDLKLRDIVVSWPKSNQITLSSRPGGVISGSVWTMSAGGSGLTKIIDGLFGLEILWSPDGSKFIYSYTDSFGRNPKLGVYDNKGNAKTLGNVSTLVDKCSWAGDSLNIYCAIPKSWPESAILPDDYYKSSFTTFDEIWKINVDTESKDLAVSGFGDANNLIADETQNSIMFVSKLSQLLYILKNLK